MNRNLIIAAIALVVLGLGAFVYFFFFASSPGVAVTPAGTTSLPLAGQAPTSGGKVAGGGVPNISSPGTPVVVTNRLIQISAGPVVPGAAIVTLKPVSASSSPAAVVSYLERESGNIFSYRTDTHTLTRIGNKTLPGIQSAAWLPNASMVFVRYLSGVDASTINTYALFASSSSGFFLPQNLADIAVSSTSVLTLASGVNGSIASLTHTDGTHSSTLFTTPLTSVRIAFAGKNQYLVFTKPSSALMGYAFLVNSSGRMTHIAGPQKGLAALPSPSGKWLLVSYSQSTTMSTELVNTSTGVALALPISTIVDKCVWAADDSSVYCGVPISPAAASYPDDWYQGATQFSDRIWNIHVSDRYAQMVLDFSQANKGSLDAVGLAVNPSKSTLVFMNKNDGSLWSYAL